MINTDILNYFLSKFGFSDKLFTYSSVFYIIFMLPCFVLFRKENKLTLVYDVTGTKKKVSLLSLSCQSSPLTSALEAQNCMASSPEPWCQHLYNNTSASCARCFLMLMLDNKTLFPPYRLEICHQDCKWLFFSLKFSVKTI